MRRDDERHHHGETGLVPLSPSLGRPGQYVPMADADVQIDHIVIGVRNLDAAQAQFEDRYGLTTIEGGRHPGWGTANRLVPLGAAYLELVTVVPIRCVSGSGSG